MKKVSFLFLVIIFSLNSFSQIPFDKGYYIDNSDQRVEGQIRYFEWGSNSDEFEYKLTDSSEIDTLTIKSVKEFGVLNKSKYIRQTVKIDRSVLDSRGFSSERNPVFKEEELFLKVLVEGKANLYSCNDQESSSFFYSTDNAEIEQLIYKTFLNADSDPVENMAFKQQLWNNLKCEDVKLGLIERLRYKETDLVRFFVHYNNCSNSEVSVFKGRKKGDYWNFSIRPGINLSSLNIGNSEIRWFEDVDFGSQLGFRFGLEFEGFMPISNKWSFLVEPTYQYYGSEKTIKPSKTLDVLYVNSVTYESIELPISLRRYHFINETSKVFANASFIYDFSFNSSLEIVDSDGESIQSLDFSPVPNFALGVGGKFNDRYVVEMRYLFKRNLLGGFVVWHSNYNTLSLIFGYTIF
jgi:hypothetical protein